MKRLLAPLIVLALALFFTGTSFAQPASSAWPMFRHDANHTGRSPDFEGPPSCGLSWSYRMQFEAASSPCIGSDGSLYIGGSPGQYLYAFDSAGGLKWAHATGQAAYGSPALDGEGKVYIGSYTDRLLSIDSGGSQVWSYQTGGDIVRSSPTIGIDGRVLIGSNDNNLYCINSSGALQWSYVTDRNVGETPAIGPNNSVCFTSGEEGDPSPRPVVFLLNSSGAMVWSYDMADYAETPLITGTPVTIYLGSHDNCFYALNSAGLAWSYRTSDNIYTSPAIGTDGRLYLGSFDYRFYAFESVGTLAWSYRTIQGIVYSSPAVGSGGAVYFGCTDNRLFSLDSAGGMRWSYLTGDDVKSSPSITGDGRVLVGSDDNILYCIGAASTPTVTPAATRTPTRTPIPTVTPVPQAEVVLNGATFGAGSPFTATFKLNRSVERPFTAYAVVVLPDGSMLDALTLGPELVPVAENVPRLDAPYSYPLMSLNIPAGTPSGNYQVMAGFFTPGQPISGPQDAFLLATSPFTMR